MAGWGQSLRESPRNDEAGNRGKGATPAVDNFRGGEIAANDELYPEGIQGMLVSKVI
jgi:hypothetical protein